MRTPTLPTAAPFYRRDAYSLTKLFDFYIGNGSSNISPFAADRKQETLALASGLKQALQDAIYPAVKKPAAAEPHLDLTHMKPLIEPLLAEAETLSEMLESPDFSEKKFVALNWRQRLLFNATYALFKAKPELSHITGSHMTGSCFGAAMAYMGLSAFQTELAQNPDMPDDKIYIQARIARALAGLKSGMEGIAEYEKGSTSLQGHIVAKEAAYIAGFMRDVETQFDAVRKVIELDRELEEKLDLNEKGAILALFNKAADIGKAAEMTSLSILPQDFNPQHMVTLAVYKAIADKMYSEPRGNAHTFAAFGSELLRQAHDRAYLSSLELNGKADEARVIKDAARLAVLANDYFAELGIKPANPRFEHRGDSITDSNLRRALGPREVNLVRADEDWSIIDSVAISEVKQIVREWHP